MTGVMHEANNAYSIWSTWLCYRRVRFLTVTYNGKLFTLVLPLFYSLIFFPLDVSLWFNRFFGCWAGQSRFWPVMKCVAPVFWFRVEYKIVIYHNKSSQRRTYFFKSEFVLGSFSKGAYGNFRVRGSFIGFTSKAPYLNLRENRTS